MPIKSKASLAGRPVLRPPDLVGGDPAMLDQTPRHGHRRHLFAGAKATTLSEQIDSRKEKKQPESACAPLPAPWSLRSSMYAYPFTHQLTSTNGKYTRCVQ